MRLKRNVYFFKAFNKDCADIKEAMGERFSAGTHKIKISDGYDFESVPVYCDSDGWTVIQSRGQHGNNIDYFFRKWAEYRVGFGEPGRY